MVSDLALFIEWMSSSCLQNKSSLCLPSPTSTIQLDLKGTLKIKPKASISTDLVRCLFPFSIDRDEHDSRVLAILNSKDIHSYGLEITAMV